MLRMQSALAVPATIRMIADIARAVANGLCVWNALSGIPLVVPIPNQNHVIYTEPKTAVNASDVGQLRKIVQKTNDRKI